MADLQLIRYKIWRAREQSELLDELTKDWVDQGLYTITYKQDRKGRLTVRILDATPLPPMYPIIVGEIAHQLRSALDHLAFATANPKTRREEDFVKFPVCSTRKRFNSTKKGSLPGLPRGVLSVVESVQPYHRRKWPDTRFLGQLQAINNWDKHRAPVIAATTIDSSTVTFKVTGETSILKEETFRGRIEPGKIIARLELGESAVGAKIEAYPNLAVFPVFDAGMPKEIAGRGVRGILNGAGSFIENEVLPRLERFF